ncbi:hypothetical protein [Brevibacillus sp. MER 51]|uniref:hypothetical protein n=1 Tax=Brevibacillus sp. MER 51 TaxID=2939560 RepID=UPI00203FE2B5|nr:hypothetical protein [Brevibacillus sp. MER 51]MCM3141679.1 hypothetical protein [Brevibacillus sp. MER 51]
MDMRYGVRLEGLLVETYDTPEEAYDDARYAYEESGLFHEVVMVLPTARGLND